MTTECRMRHETSTITRPGWSQTHEPIMCAHFDGRSCIVHIKDGTTVITTYRDGKPGSITYEIEEPYQESFQRECDYWLREATP